MYKVFIVDDEPSARLGLSECFPWEQYGCVVVGEAENGKEALDKISRLKPDIVLTDVKMPYVDGIELAKQINLRFPEIKIIFISGYNDIRYLKEAFHVSAIDYIFKPINLKEVERVIGKATGSLGNEQKQQALILRMESQLIQSMPFLKEKFFMTLIRDNDFRKEELEKKMKFLNISFPADGLYSIVLVSVDSSAEIFGERSERDSQLLSFAILNVLQELLERIFIGYSFEESRGEYVCIICLKRRQQENIMEFAEEVQKNLLQSLDLSITIGIGAPVESLEELRNSYHNAAKAVSQRLFIGQNKVIVMEEEEAEEQKRFQPDFGQIERLSGFLKAGETQAVERELESFFLEVSRHHEMSKQYIQSLCMNFFLLPNQLLYECGEEAEQYMKNELRQIEDFYKLETLSEMKLFVMERCRRVCAYFESRRDSKQRSLIRRIQEIIKQRYAENITINQIADEVFFSATYLSFIFKQETGQTINDYITFVRIEKAKELLADPTIRSYEVCRSVGYQDAGYFSKIFKKYTGCSPSQYREKL